MVAFRWPSSCCSIFCRKSRKRQDDTNRDGFRLGCHFRSLETKPIDNNEKVRRLPTEAGRQSACVESGGERMFDGHPSFEPCHCVHTHTNTNFEQFEWTITRSNFSIDRIDFHTKQVEISCRNAFERYFSFQEMPCKSTYRAPTNNNRLTRSSYSRAKCVTFGR